MSLLTSPNTTKEQLKFLNKMQKYYHKRGGSQYISRDRSLSQSIPFTTKIPVAVNKLKEYMQQFMIKINTLIQQFTIIDHYAVLELMRKHQFFSDVAVKISQDLFRKIQQLQIQLANKEQKIQGLKKDIKIMRNQSKDDHNRNKSSDGMDKLENFSNKNMIKYNPSKSMAANLYYHARALEQPQFIAYYDKVSLSNPITLKKVQNLSAPYLNTNSSNKSNSASDPNINLSVPTSTSLLTQKITSLINTTVINTNSHNTNNEPIIMQLIQALKQSVYLLNHNNNNNNSNIKSRQCRNPCCLQKIDSPDTRENKAKKLISSTTQNLNKISTNKNSNSNNINNNNNNNNKHDVYKDDKSEQYFKRYFNRGSGFHLKDVTSIQRTKMEEMEKIQDQHRKNLKARKKYQNYHNNRHRYSYSYTRE